jgi:beta-mannosidase
MPAAAALRAADRWDLDRPRDFDAEDWWFRCVFAASSAQTRGRLRLDGLATVADAWLNGVHILHSDSMFTAHVVDVDRLSTDNELLLRCQAIGSLLASRRPRPRWRAALVSNQQLRWFRTTLLGRMPAWCPPVAPVGPWRPVLFEPASSIHFHDPYVSAGLDGDEGVVRVSMRVAGAAAEPISGTLSVGDLTVPMEFDSGVADAPALRALIRVPHARRWWPHTHGEQPLYPVSLAIATRTETAGIDLGRVGFRTVEIDRGPDGDGFGLVVNGVPIFCRGVCWTPLDLARLDADPSDYRSALERLRDAGMNMLRVGGTMVYETDGFHDLCDELGILVWQDFMFANMDYPSSDDVFTRAVAVEARQLLERLQGRPSLAILCGNSEVAQQAAMLGLPATHRQHPLFDDVLPGLAGSLAPGVPWLDSTPSGGTLPFHPGRGVAHYYGVGAYLRPFEDARRAGVRFTAECLAFSNVPDAAIVDAFVDQGAVPGPHPRWKAGVPRDAGAGWDFEDTRDHYVRLLFGMDPSDLRARDVERYLAFGRIATGEAMLRTFAEWRRPGSSCRGGLVWLARDLRPGAGWGILDSSGSPKAAYWYLKRAFAPLALFAVDEGLNGLWLHAVNDTREPIEAELQVALYREGRPRGERVSRSITVPERGFCSMHADSMFDGFVDLTYAYRFGPPGHDVVAATLRDCATGSVLAAAHCFPCGLPAQRDSALGLSAQAQPLDNGFAVLVRADRFAHACTVTAEGYVPDDNYFHLEPGARKRVVLRPEAGSRALRLTVSALNAPNPFVLDVVAEAAHAE